ncbi:hypothetical protein MTO96_035905 [Rhipicephalus appendiculatus]
MESNHATTEVTARNGQLVTNGDVATNAAKRQRKDEDNVSETTESCFDEDLPDADPFITVNYKKQQRQGIPVVFHSAPDRSFLACKPKRFGYRDAKDMDILLNIAEDHKDARYAQVLTVIRTARHVANLDVLTAMDHTRLRSESVPRKRPQRSRRKKIYSMEPENVTDQLLILT